MRVRVEPAFAVGLGLAACLDPGGALVPFLCAAALHEAAHLAALRLLRVPVSALRIGLSGAVIETAPLSDREALPAALSGPGCNLLLALLLRGLPLFARINLALALGNLLPVYPLDGGRAVRALAPKAAQAISGLTFFALLLGGIGLTLRLRAGLWPLILLLLLSGRLLLCREDIP